MHRAWTRHLDLFVLGAVGVFFLGGARYGVIVDDAPGPGLAPVVFASALVVLVLIEGFARLRKRARVDAEIAREEVPSFGSLRGWTLCLGALAALILFGGVIGTFVSLLAVGFVAIEDRRPRTLVVGALFATITAVAIYAVFGVVFKLPMIPALIPLR